MLKGTVAKSAVTEWASPAWFAPKKHGSLQYCVMYCHLNVDTERDSYPIPRMVEYMDSLAKAKVFSTLDTDSGYWQNEMDWNHFNKTAFGAHNGFFK